MHQALEGLNGIAIVADDILVFGEGDTDAEAEQDHDRNLRKLLERCRMQSLKINKDKMKYKLEEVKFIGHIITKNGIKPDDDKILAIKELKAPNNLKELKTFLGMINYLAKFLPSLSEET